MADRSGIGAQFGCVAESTYGTGVTVTRFLPFLNESLALSIERMESAGLRTGQRVMRSDSWASGKKQAAGSVAFDVGNKGFGLLLAKALGAAAQTADGVGFKRTYTIGDLFGDMLTIQIGRPDLAGTVQPFTYVGSKIAKWALEQNRDDFLKLNLDIDARDETTATGLATATSPTLTELFHWAGFAITIGGAAWEIDAFSLECDNKLNTDRFKLRGNTLKDEPVEAEKREITGKVRTEFNALTDYARFTGGTTAQIIATWTAVSTYDTAKPFKLVVTLPTCRFDAAPGNVKDADIEYLDLDFKVLDSGSGQPITVDYYTSDATD